MVFKTLHNLATPLAPNVMVCIFLFAHPSLALAALLFLAKHASTSGPSDLLLLLTRYYSY